MGKPVKRSHAQRKAMTSWFHRSQVRTVALPEPEAERRAREDAVAKFLANGGSVTKVPTNYRPEP